MGCKCCKRRNITKILDYDILDTNENETSEPETNNNEILSLQEISNDNNNNKIEKKEKEKKGRREKEEEEELKGPQNEILIEVKEEEKESNEEINKDEEKSDINAEEIKNDERVENKNKDENILKIEINEINEKEKNNLLMPYELILKEYLDEKIDSTEVFDKKWYSDLEKDKIIYSKRSIIAFIRSCFDEKNTEFIQLYNKDPLIIAINSNGTFLSNEFQVVRSIYTINKSIYPPKTSIRMIAKYLNFVKERSSWDTQLKSYKIIEGSEDGSEVKCVVQNWLKSPMFLVSERDIIDKRYEFFYEGKFYSCESSVNDDYYPLEENVTRINDIISIEELYEENDNVVLKAITQMNTKVSLPQTIVNATLANKLLDFYKALADAMNNDFENGKLVFEDNNGNII